MPSTLGFWQDAETQSPVYMLFGDTKPLEGVALGRSSLLRAVCSMLPTDLQTGQVLVHSRSR